MFPAYVRSRETGELIPFAEFHHDLWSWVWAMRPGIRPRPFVAIWPRGFAKSTNAEMAVATLAASRRRRYGLYVSSTQSQAEDHLRNVATLLETKAMAEHYPEAASRGVNKYNVVKGWSAVRLSTGSGFTLDALGLDTAARGIKVEDARPDFLILDDIDGELDAPGTTEKKITTITKKLIPAGSEDLAILFVQNLITENSVASRLAGVSEFKADFMADRIVSGPHPAVRDLEVEQRPTEDGGLKWTIVAGSPSWPEHWPLERCQNELDDMGLSAFMTECQHAVEPPPGGMFDQVDFIRCDLDEVPALVRGVVAVDPAVTDTDASDSHGVQADGIDSSEVIYRLRSWEKRTSPEDSIRRAITWALELGFDTVIVETDQGGDAWRSVYQQVWTSMVEQMVEGGELGHFVREDGSTPIKPKMLQRKGGAVGTKAERAGRMLVDYERPGRNIVHVRGTHQVLERGMRRFPKTKPYDLVDASFWSWDYLRNGGTPVVAPAGITGRSKWLGAG